MLRTSIKLTLASILGLTLVLFSVACTQSRTTQAKQPLWLNTTLSPEVRTELLLQAMTLEQKQQQLVGNVPEIIPELPQCFGARHVRGIKELGIPTLRITNGPVGIGQNDCVDPSVANQKQNPFAAYTHPSSAKATALPSAIGIAASFDHDVARSFGEVIAREAHAMALHVFEAPGVNLARNPVLGRNFEYKGEDPYLTGSIAVTEIRTIQDAGIIAMAKHFAANEQETNRLNVSQTIGEQVLHELYLLPFEMAVKEGEVAALMCSYNDLNGSQACENETLLTEILRTQWGFKGYVQSDFFAVKSTAKSLVAGLDHLMPIPSFWSQDRLDKALAKDELTPKHIDIALGRRYQQMFKLGIFERPLVQKPLPIEEGGRKARAMGSASTVLLQNNQTLPFSNDIKSVALIGKATQVYAQQAVAGGVMVGHPMGAGGGSSDVVPYYTVPPLQGIKNVLQELGNTEAKIELTLVDDDNSNIDQAIEAAKQADAVIIMAGSIAEEGADRATFADEIGLNAALSLGDNLDWYTDVPNKITSLARTDGKNLNPERNSQTIAMIEMILAATGDMFKKTAVVLKDNAGIAIPNSGALLGNSGPAILEVWFPGQEDGHIVADVLFGSVNPSGKTPVTFPIAGKGFLDTIAKDAIHFPGTSAKANGWVDTTDVTVFPPLVFEDKALVEYKEGLNIGYRWYDSNSSGKCALREDLSNPCVAFPFGHGLSYTEFSVGDASLIYNTSKDTYTVNLPVTNEGNRQGKTVIQVYLWVPAPKQPPKRLVAFQKVSISSGETVLVSLDIDPSSANHPLGIYDTELKQFTIPAGPFIVYVGTSSSLRDLQILSFNR